MKGFFSFWGSSSKAQKSVFSLVLLFGVAVGGSVFFLNLGGKTEFSIPEAHGQNGGGGPPTGQLCGFAWMGSDVSSAVPTQMGSGWISFNSKDCDTNNDGVISPGQNGDADIPGCPATTTPVYNVTVTDNGSGQQTRQINGYAWSSNLGWLKFGNGDITLRNGTVQHDGYGDLDTNAMPQFSNYPRSQSQISSSANGVSDVTGFARFCVATTGRDCSSSNAEFGDWDGWVALAATANGQNNGLFTTQYNSNTNRFFGWSWGGGATGTTTSPVGWVKWDPTNDRGAQYCFVETLNVALYPSPAEFTQSTTSLSYNPTLRAVASPAGVSTDFKFSCDPNQGLPFTGWVSNGTDTYSTTACSYPIGQGLLTTDAPYSPQVVSRRPLNGGNNGSYLYATTSANIIVHRPPQPNDLGAICSATPTHTQVHGNIVWQVQLTTPGAAGDTYNYDFQFADGQGATAINNTQSTTTTVTRTYNTTGAKLLTTYITDNTSNRTGQCNTRANITVNPNVTEF